MKPSGTFRPIYKTKLIRAWFAERRRWHILFAPTSSSWISQVERFFVPGGRADQARRSDGQPSRRHPGFGGTLSSSDDQPSRTTSIVLAILASSIKSKLRTGVPVDVHPVSPRNTEASQPQLP
jgi:hypothetical protein